MTQLSIAIDAMGGDKGVDVTIPAALEALKNHVDLHLFLVGQETIIHQKLKECRISEVDFERITVCHASEVVAMDELPSHALRKKKDSSMRVAINLVKEGRANACVSAGNTGALMATARFVLKTLPGIDRPAIIASFPTRNPNKQVRVLDLGANVDSDANHLYQFAVMGAALVCAVDGIDNPRIGLLNVGEEEIKGNGQVKKTAQLLTEKEDLNYIGYVEGDSFFSEGADVIVCDGFVGNVTLKTIEGAAKLIVYFAKTAFKESFFSRFVGFLSSSILKKIAGQIDPRRRNGASLLGLNGIVIKSHGGADVYAYTHAINEAVLEAKNNIPERIQERVGKFLDVGEE